MSGAGYSRFITFSRAQWARLRKNTPLTLSQADLLSLQSLNDVLSLAEVEEIYLPLSRLLSLHVMGTRALRSATGGFLEESSPTVPFIIGLAGSVAVGKSTSARLLRALLAHWPDHPAVELITTDGFLYPNAVLQERGLMARKGFPESYDTARLIAVLSALKAGEPEVNVPTYSHQLYDVVPGHVVLRRPDIVIVEGLNVLQAPPPPHEQVYASDFFDFSIYVDADEAHIQSWYVARFLKLRQTVFTDPSSYFHRYAALSEAEAVEIARQLWSEINGRNLRENILPTRSRAHLVLTKDAQHSVQQILLRRL